MIAAASTRPRESDVILLGDTMSGAVSDSVFEPGMRLELPAQMSGRIGRLVVWVQEFKELPLDVRSRAVRKLSSGQLERACAVIRERHTHPVRLPEIAAVAGLSACQFSRSFRCTTGMTLTAYILRLRLDTAMRLMRQTRLSLSDVALRSGFGDHSQFSRMFVRVHRITPSRWRNYERMSDAPSQT